MLRFTLFVLSLGLLVGSVIARAEGENECKKASRGPNIELAFKLDPRHATTAAMSNALGFAENRPDVTRIVYFFDRIQGETHELFSRGVVLRVRIDEEDGEVSATTTAKYRPTRQGVQQQAPQIPAVPSVIHMLKGFKAEIDKGMKQLDPIRWGRQRSVSLKVEKVPSQVRATITDRQKSKWDLYDFNQRALIRAMTERDFTQTRLSRFGPVRDVKIWEKKLGTAYNKLKLTLEKWPFPGQNPIVEISVKFDPAKEQLCTGAFVRFIRQYRLVMGPAISKTEFTLKNIQQILARQRANR